VALVGVSTLFTDYSYVYNYDGLEYDWREYVGYKVWLRSLYR
jgi:hypothetical protein